MEWGLRIRPEGRLRRLTWRVLGDRPSGISHLSVAALIMVVGSPPTHTRTYCLNARLIPPPQRRCAA
jgi:hypothetical protein